MVTTRDHSYLPSRAELNEAIADVLHDNETATPKEVRSVLLKDHRTWKVPERRVAKFVKRQKRQSASGDIDDDESTMTQSTLQRTKHAIKGAAKRASTPFKSVFGRKKKPVEDIRVESAMMKREEATEATSLLPTMLNEEADDEKEVDILEPQVETTAPKIDIEPRELELIYQDDNDGKKESKGLCAPCEGCSIL